MKFSRGLSPRILKKVVIDGQLSATYRDNDGICHISLIDFLLNPHSLETL